MASIDYKIKKKRSNITLLLKSLIFLLILTQYFSFNFYNNNINLNK